MFSSTGAKPATSLLQSAASSTTTGDELLEPTPEALQKKIDEIGFGPFQILMVVCCGGIMASEGSEVNVMGSITTLLAGQWGLGAFVRAFMTSIVFVGFACGGLLSGYIGDSFGRRPAILLAYAVIFSAGLLTSLSESPVVMVCIRIFVGFGCGIGFPSVYSFIPEVTPVYLRGAKTAVMISFMPLGEFYSSLGVFLLDKNLLGTTVLGYSSWRALIQWSCIPPFFLFWLSFFFLEESPHFLLSRGRIVELNEVLAGMARWNNAPNVNTSFPLDLPEASARSSSAKKEENKFSWGDAMAEAFSGAFIRTTLFLGLANFTKDFAYFGLGYVFPQYFQETAGKLPVGLEMMIISLLAIPGVLAATILTRMQSIGHITCLSLTGTLTGLASFGLLDFIHWSVSAYFVKFFAMTYFIVVIVYNSEVFPTRIRNSAIGVCTGMGRLGSISSPILFELLKRVTASFDPWWCILIALSWTVALFAPVCLNIETKGRALTTDSSPATEQTSLGKHKGAQYASA